MLEPVEAVEQHPERRVDRQQPPRLRPDPPIAVLCEAESTSLK